MNCHMELFMLPHVPLQKLWSCMASHLKPCLTKQAPSSSNPVNQISFWHIKRNMKQVQCLTSRSSAVQRSSQMWIKTNPRPEHSFTSRSERNFHFNPHNIMLTAHIQKAFTFLHESWSSTFFYLVALTKKLKVTTAQTGLDWGFPIVEPKRAWSQLLCQSASCILQ